MTASRKVGNAVVRNRAKRVVREAFRATSDLFGNGIDLVVIVRAPLGDTRLGEVVDEWRAAAHVIGRRTAQLLARAPGPRKTSGENPR